MGCFCLVARLNGLFCLVARLNRLLSWACQVSFAGLGCSIVQGQVTTMGHNKQSYGNGGLEAAGLAPPLPFGALQPVEHCNGRNEDPFLGICSNFIFW